MHYVQFYPLNTIPRLHLSPVDAFIFLLNHIIMAYFTGKVVRSPYGVMHGKSSPVYYDEKGSQGLFSGLPK